MKRKLTISFVLIAAILMSTCVSAFAASLVTNSTAQSLSPTYVSNGTGSAALGGGYLFYSNNPESVYTSHLADNGKWLNKATVTGAGQVYTWHVNKTGSTIKSCLLIYNPNNYTIKVTSTNRGLTNGNGITDSNAWTSYFQGSTTSITVAAKSYGNMFLQSVPNNYNFGIVARTNVTNNSTGAVASAIFHDIAYISNSGGANSFAAAVAGSKRRGLAPNYYCTMNFATVSPTNANGIAYKIGTQTDTFNGNDLAYVTDGSGATSGPLDGAYGEQIQVSIPIKNTTGTARSFRIYIGSNGGYSFPLVNLSGTTAKYQWIPAFKYVDVIDSGVIANGSTVTVTFFTVVPAISSTPYVIGVRTL